MIRGSLGRVAAVARAAARDLFAGQGGALAFLLLFGVWIGTLAARAPTEEERLVVAVRQRTALVAALAALAAILCTAHAVADDRRTRRLVQWLASPLRPLEYVVGKFLGAFAGLALVAVPLHAGLLLFSSDGFAAHGDLFSPRAQVTASEVRFSRADGQHMRWRRGTVTLEPGCFLELDFAALPGTATADGCLVQVGLRELPGAAPGLKPAFALHVGERLIAQRIEFSTQLVKSGLLLRDPPAPPFTVRLDVLPDAAALVALPTECCLLGARSGLAASVARATLGLLALLACATGFAAGLAAFLPDAMALVAAGTLLMIGFLRGLLVDVTASVALDHEHVAAGTRRAAELLAQVLRLVPDLAQTVAADRVAQAEPPFAAADAAALTLPVVAAGVALAAGAAWLRRTKGAAP